jgi:hypothetical protein
MALLKRVALIFAEAGLLLLGFGLSVLVASLLNSSGENDFPEIGFFSGLLLTAVGWLTLHYKTRRWKIRQDAARWIANRSFAKKYPQRAEFLRIAHRWLLWVPSACAALALFFLPVASHVPLAGRSLVPHYNLSTPLSWMVIPTGGRYNRFVRTFFSGEGAARFGMTSMWLMPSTPSDATFSIGDPRVREEDWSLQESELARFHGTHLAEREFKMGTITMKCWEYRHKYAYSAEVLRNMLRPVISWEVLCATEPNGVDFNLAASFFGREEDIPAFYRVLESAKPTR